MTTMPETSGMDDIAKKWNMGNIPPEGHEYVGKFWNQKWEAAKREKIDRLGLHDRWLGLHSQWRGKRRRRTFPIVGANYLYKTMSSFCAVLTEKTPQSEVRSDDNPDEARVLDAEIQGWWESEEMQDSLFAAVQNMQVYGAAIEKGVFDVKEDMAKIHLTDNFNFFPEPGYKRGNLNIPAVYEVVMLEPWEIRKTFGVEESIQIPTDADEQLIGGSRETVRGGKVERSLNDRHYPSNYSDVGPGGDSEVLKNKTMTIEIWCRDDSEKTEKIMEDVEVYDDLGRAIGIEEVPTGETVKRKVYPDGIRKITICPALMDTKINGVLDDQRNPNINWALLDMQIEQLTTEGQAKPIIQNGQPLIDPNTQQPAIQMIPVPKEEAVGMIYQRAKSRFWLWGKYPYSVTYSQLDNTQWWGFSMIEELEEMQGEAQKLLTRYFSFLYMSMFPIMKNPEGSGVPNSKFTNAPGLVVNPTVATAQFMGYIQPPNPPRGLLELLQFVLSQIDTISQSPEVTQGIKPSGVSAASAIIALQDKAATLFQPQIRSVDKLVRNRGRMGVHFVLNFGTKEKPVKVDEQFVKYVGTDLEAEFKMHVESGSSAPITKAGRRNQYVELFKVQAMDLESLLEMLEIPNYETVVERIMERTSLPGALDVLIQAGLPEETAQQLYAFLMQAQQGQGRAKNRKQGQAKTGSTAPTGPPGGSSESMVDTYKQMDTVG